MNKQQLRFFFADILDGTCVLVVLLLKVHRILRHGKCACVRVHVQLIISYDLSAWFGSLPIYYLFIFVISLRFLSFDFRSQCVWACSLFFVFLFVCLSFRLGSVRFNSSLCVTGSFAPSTVSSNRWTTDMHIFGYKFVQCKSTTLLMALIHQKITCIVERLHKMVIDRTLILDVSNARNDFISMTFFCFIMKQSPNLVFNFVLDHANADLLHRTESVEK